MCAHAYDKTLMLLIAFVRGTSYSYLSQFKLAQTQFKFARDIAEEIQQATDPDLVPSQLEENIGHFITEKNFKIVAYSHLAEAYFYDANHRNSIRAYKKLLMLAWKHNDEVTEFKAF